MFMSGPFIVTVLVLLFSASALSQCVSVSCHSCLSTVTLSNIYLNVLLNSGFVHGVKHFHMLVSVLEARNLPTSSTTDLRLLLEASGMT